MLRSLLTHSSKSLSQISFTSILPSIASASTSTHHYSTNTTQYDHWIDRFPSLRSYLETANRGWWIKGLQARCEQYYQLQGRELLLRFTIESEYDRLFKLHSNLTPIVDSRTRTHLSVACLAIATYKTLLSFLRDEELVMEIISEHMGAHTTPALVFMMKMVAWLQRDRYVALVNRLRALKLDYGKSFESELIQGPEQSSLTISSCFYHTIFELEEIPQLTAVCCCSQDRVWLEGALPKRGVVAGLERCIAQGDDCCRFYVEKR